MPQKTSNTRIMLTINPELYTAIKSTKGFGTKDAEKCKNIIIAHLSEKGYLTKKKEN